MLIKNLPTNFVILNSYNNKIAFQSNSKNPITNPNFFTYKLGNISYDKATDSSMENEIQSNNIRYSYYKKFSNYPLVVLSGYDYNSYKMQLFKLIAEAIYPNLTIGIFLIIILLLFYKRIVYPINNLSEIARKISSGNFDIEFPKNIGSPEIFNLAKAIFKIKRQRKLEQSNTELAAIKEQLEEAIEIIRKSDLAQIEITKQIRKEILKNTKQAFYTIGLLKHNIVNHNSQEGKLNMLLINSLEQEIKNITQFATDELTKEYVQIRSIIDKVVLSQEKEIKIRNIKVFINYNKNLPKKVFVDQIRLIQILSGVLHKTINLLSDGNHVKINVKPTMKNKIRHLLISIEDDGFGIGFKEYINDIKKLGGKEEGSINGIDISVDTIEELVKLHQGEIVYNNIIQQSSITKIIIPCLKEIKKDAIVSDAKTMDNIIYLPIKNRDN